MPAYLRVLMSSCVARRDEPGAATYQRYLFLDRKQNGAALSDAVNMSGWCREGVA